MKDFPSLQNSLSVVLADEHRNEESLAAAKVALALAEKQLGPMHPDVAEVLSNLSTCYDQIGQTDLALAVLERSIDIRERALGKNHPILNMGWMNMATLLMHAGRDEEALAASQRALGSQERVDPDTREMAWYLYSTGYFLSVLDRNAEARAHLVRAITIEERLVGRDHPLVATMLLALGVVAGHEGQFAEGARLITRALKIDERAHSSFDVACDLAALGELELERDRPAKAVERLTSAVATGGEALRRSRRGYPAIQFNLARALWDSGGDRMKARSLAEAALAHYPASASHRPKKIREIERWLEQH